MPNIPLLGRQDASSIEDAALEAMLSGPDVPEDLAAGLQPASDVLAALRARPSGDELAGEAFAMAEFRNRVGVREPVRRSRPRRRPALLTSLLSAKVAVAAAAAAIAVGGAATAALAGVLPPPVQRLAHAAIGAPAEGHASHGAPAEGHASHPSGSGTARGRSASRLPLRHYHVRYGCWTPKILRPSMAWPHPSVTPSAHPSLTPKPRPACTPAPRPSRTPEPHKSFMPRKFRHHRRHHHRRYPVYSPGPRPTGSPSPRPTSMPSPKPSAQG
jgi:hypothetical protein